MAYKQTEIGMIPGEWKTELLGNLIEDIFCGRDPKGGKRSHSKEVTTTRIIQSAAVFDGYLDLNKTGYISDEIAQNLNSASIMENDVLLNQLGDGITFARSCVVPKKAIPSVITRSVGCIRCKLELLDPWFLNAYLVLPQTKKYIESFNSGSSRRAIDGGKMKSFILPIPPIEEQKKIGIIYKNILKKIEINRQIDRICETISQILFKQWFIDFEFPNKEGKPYKSSDGEMGYSEKLGKKIPKSWKVGKLEDLLDNVKNPLKPGNHLKDRKYVPISLLPMKKIGIENYQNYSEAKSSLIAFEKNDILMGAMRVYFHRVCLSPFAGITRTTTFVLRPKTKDLLSYALFLLNLDSTIEYANLHSKGTTMPYAYWEGSLSDMDVIIPDNEVIELFNNVVYPILIKIRDSIFETLTLKEIKDVLLPKLMSGKIRVSTSGNNGE